MRKYFSSHFIATIVWMALLRESMQERVQSMHHNRMWGARRAYVWQTQFCVCPTFELDRFYGGTEKEPDLCAENRRIQWFDCWKPIETLCMHDAWMLSKYVRTRDAAAANDTTRTSQTSIQSER